MKRILLLTLALLAWELPAQSPWARNKAGFYAQAGFNFIPTYGTLFGQGGRDIVLDHEVTERQIQLYGEYGLTKNTTVIVALPYVMNERGNDNPDSPLMFPQEATGKLSGLGNTTIALRHQFLRGPVALAGTLRVGLPAATDYQPLTDLRTGYNAITLTPMASAGMGFRKSYGFVYGAYGYRSNNYSHFIQSGVEIGLRLGKFWLAGFSELVYPLGNGDRLRPNIDVLTGLYIDDQGWLSIGAKAIWEINRFWGVSLSGAGAAWAQNVAKSPGLGAAVYVKWD